MLQFLYKIGPKSVKVSTNEILVEVYASDVLDCDVMI